MKKIAESEQDGDLHRQAEELLREGKGSLAGSKADEGRDRDPMALIHELQVHQIELEMQNEELKRARLEAENAMKMYSDLYDFAPIGLFTLNEQGAIKEVNLAGDALLGQERRNLLGRRFLLFVAPEDRRSFNEFCKKTLETSATQTCELRLAKDKGSPVYVHIEATVTEDRLHNVRQCRIAIIDITERKRAEEELQQANDELELKVKERTADLFRAKENLVVANVELQVELEKHKKLEADLMKAKEAAEAAVEAKAAFLANMSHELRTPMNYILGSSSLLQDDDLKPEQKEYLDEIMKGGEALLAIINDILEVSRADKGNVELEHQPFSLKHCIEESLDMVVVQAKKKDLKLVYTINYGTPDTILGDHGRLRQILANLLANAVKFTDEGEVSISVSSKPVEDNKQEILFEVRDTGIGIPEHEMDRLFKPFTQLEYNLSRKRDGAGLGLSISKRLAELMGGRIWAESEDGKGSTFSFTIQAEAIHGKGLGLRETVGNTAYKNLAFQKPLSILVAEDNPSNQKVLVEMLRKMGYRPDAVADGKEVLQALGIRHYDLILMDIKMPEMNGLDATREIRRLWPENGPKIVAITAFAMDGDREKCLEAGMDDYIAKPVKMSDLAGVLRNITPCKNKI